MCIIDELEGGRRTDAIRRGVVSSKQNASLHNLELALAVVDQVCSFQVPRQESESIIIYARYR